MKSFLPHFVFLAALWLVQPDAILAEGTAAGLKIADTLSPRAGVRAAGAALGGTATESGAATWTTSFSVVLSAVTGVTSTEEKGGTAVHSLPTVSGKYKMQADIKPSGSGWTGLAMGRIGLADDFWAAYGLLVYLTPGGAYEVLAGGVPIAKGDRTSYKEFQPEGFNTVALEYDSLAATVSVRINGTTVLDAHDVTAKKAGLRIESAGFRFNESVTPNAPVVRNYSAEVAAEITSGLRPVNVDDFFIAPDKSAELTWKAASIGRKDRLAYKLTDYVGHVLKEGECLPGGDGMVRLSLEKLPRGYYEVSFPECGEVFGLVSNEAQVGAADPFFCMDAALSWLESREDVRPSLTRILRRSGIAMARERLDWGAINPSKDKWDWEGGPRKYATMRQHYVAAGVPTLEMLHGGAQHLGMLGNTPYPQNLVEISRSWIAMGTKLKSTCGAAEVWNEPDLIALPADQYAVLTKVAAWAFREAHVETPLVGGVYATLPPGSYFDTSAANGMFDQVDAVSFHAYDHAPDMIGMIGRYRTWLAASGKGTMPLWLTECGLPWAMGTSRPAADQDATSALEIVMKGVEARAGGVARYFPFVYAFYEEGRKNFGMMGREATPLRSMAAYAHLAGILAGKSYVGDLETGSPTVKLARVFGDDTSARLIVLYTAKLNSAASIKLSFAVDRIAGIDGRPLMKNSDGAIPIPDGLTYLWINATKIATALKTETAAAPLSLLGRQSPPVRPDPSPLVLQYLFSDTPSRVSARRYLLAETTARKLPIHVRLWNLSTRAEKVVVTLQLPGSASPAHELAGVEVPAQAFADCNWTVNALDHLDVADTRFIRIAASSESGAKIAPLAIPLVVEGSLEVHLSRHAKKVRLPIHELNRWQRNIAEHGTMTMSAAEDHWQTDVSFAGPGDYWLYPLFNLPSPIDRGMAGLLVRARISKPARNVGLMLQSEGQGDFRALDLFPADGAWHVVYVPFDEFRPGPGHPDMQNARLNPGIIKQISVGFGSVGKTNMMELSDLILVGK